MARYKLIHKGIHDRERMLWLKEGNPDYIQYWPEYQAWLALGNTPDPFYDTVEEYAQWKFHLVKSEAARRIKSIQSTINDRGRARLIRKESKGTATPKEKAKLDTWDSIDDQIDIIDNQVDAAELWLEDPSRTYAEVDSYDPEVDPWL